MSERVDTVAKKMASSKKRNDGMTTQESAIESSEFGGLPPLDIECVHSKFLNQPHYLNHVLKHADSCGVDVRERELFLKVSNILLVEKDTNKSWYSKFLNDADSVHGEVDVLSCGIHIDNLNVCWLPRQAFGKEVLIQSLGRVGRPRQGAGTCIGTLNQYEQMFSGKMGIELEACLMQSVKKTIEQA